MVWDGIVEMESNWSPITDGIMAGQMTDGDAEIKNGH
jgi:hypothetical protein